MKLITGARSSVVATLLVVLAGLGIAACGGSSSSTTTSIASASAATGTSTSAGTGTPGHFGGGGFASRLTATQKSCLAKQGVTLPTGHGFTRTGTAPTGAPPAGGTSTTGHRGFGGGAFFGGGAGSSKFLAAFKACGVSFGGGRFAGGAAAKPSAAAVASFAACVKKGGYTLPTANLTGKGPIYPASIESNAKFEAAAKNCIKDLNTGRRPVGGFGGYPGGGAPGGPPAGTSTASSS